MSDGFRVVRWFIVWLTAFCLRRDLTADDMMGALARAFPHRDAGWRLAVLSDARARNDRRKVNA